MKPANPSFAQRLKQTLEQRKLNQRTLAKLTGVTASAVTKWLAGKPPSPEKAEELAKVLGVAVAWLIEGRQVLREKAHKRLAEQNAVAAPLRAVREAMDRLDVTVGMLAKLIGYNLGVVTAVMEGRAPASEKMIEAMSRALSVDKDALMGGSDSPSIFGDTVGTHGAKPTIIVPPGMSVRMVPLLSLAQAGEFDAAHLDEGRYEFEAVPVLDLKGRAFAIKVRGDSMVPDVREGDIVICRVSVPAVPESIPANKLVVVRTHSGNAHLKYWRSNGKTVTLESANKDHPPIAYALSEIAGAHIVVQVIQHRSL